MKLRVEWRGDRARRTFLYPKPVDPSDELMFGLLSIPENGDGTIKTDVIVDGKFYRSSAPTNVHAVLMSSLFPDPNDLEMEKLKGLGFSITGRAAPQTQQPTQAVQTCISDYTPEKLTLMFLDQEAKEVIAPQVFMDGNNQLKIKISLNVMHKHFILRAKWDGENMHYQYGVGYSAGLLGRKRDFAKAANKFHQQLLDHPNDEEACHKPGCLFRYARTLRDDASKLEYLGVSAERGHAGARYEWSKMILKGHYANELRVQAAKYLLELMRPECEPDDHLLLRTALDEAYVLHAAGCNDEAFARL